MTRRRGSHQARFRAWRQVAASGSVGLVLVVLLAGWVLLSRPEAPSAVATATTILLAPIGWLLGGAAARVHPALPGLTVAIVVGAAVVVTLPGSLSGAPLAPPLGYGNADGMLLLAATGGLLVAARHVPPNLRMWFIGGAVLATVLCGLTRSISTAVSGLLLLVCGVRRQGSARAWQIAPLGLLAGAVALTVLLGAHVLPLSSIGLSQTLDPARVRLWSDALTIAEAHPVRGVGAGAFSTYSPTAHADADLAQAHSAPLQFAAENGWVGFALAVLVVLWAALALNRDAIVLTAFLLPATIDYVLDFGWVVLALGFVLGGTWAAERFDSIGRYPAH